MTLTDLILPKRGIMVPEPPRHLALDMAFNVGVGAKLFDKSRYRSHGTISGADWAAGVHGYCLDFVPANSDHVVIAAADSTQLNFTGENFAIIVRIYPDDVTANRAYFDRGSYHEDGYYFYQGGDGKPRCEFHQSGQHQTVKGSALTVSTWHTVGLSRWPTTAAIYVDGVDVTETCDTLVDPASADRVATIGALSPTGAAFFDGKIEFLRIWRHVALSEANHKAWHDALA